MKIKKNQIILLCLLAALFQAFYGCGEKREEKIKISYRLKWLFNASVAGDIYAGENGFFDMEGLDVEVKEGGPERDAIKELEMGHAQFGVASADQVIRAVSKGSPIVVVAQLFQENPLQWIYRPDVTAVKKPEDMRGRVVGVTFGGNDETIMKAVFAKYGIRENEVSLFSVRYDYTPFYEKKVALWPVYRNAQGIIIGDQLEKAKEKIEFFDPDAAGIRFVANSVITTEKMVTEHPETVKKFVSALMKAWNEALSPANSGRTVETIIRFDRDTAADVVARQLEMTRRFMIPSDKTVFGKIDVEAWKQTESIMVEQKLIPSPVVIEKRLKTEYVR
jgi:NitT/TauT family transport system substrate-binding protein